jgi:hypothetical protein
MRRKPWRNGAGPTPNSRVVPTKDVSPRVAEGFRVRWVPLTRDRALFQPAANSAARRAPRNGVRVM